MENIFVQQRVCLFKPLENLPFAHLCKGIILQVLRMSRNLNMLKLTFKLLTNLFLLTTKERSAHSLRLVNYRPQSLRHPLAAVEIGLCFVQSGIDLIQRSLARGRSKKPEILKDTGKLPGLGGEFLGFGRRILGLPAEFSDQLEYRACELDEAGDACG
ncbi:hypothetical protein HG530_006955 [Fusarium avenaceum]|nr:hypothetical protein HG530_006955 [Fusarium avenaceum]